MTATISADDWGLLYGYGLFETVRSYDGVPFQLDEHIDRMLASARDLRFGPVPAHTEIAMAVARCCEDAPNAAVRFTLTRGSDACGQPPRLLLSPRPIAYTPAQYSGGVAVTIAASTRDAWSPLLRHKTLNQLQNMLAWRAAVDDGFDECLFFDHHGRLAEGSRSNVFVVAGGAVMTPSSEAGLLPGIARRTVLAILRDARIAVREGAVTFDDLMCGDEVFLTNSVMEVLPVNRIGRRVLRPRPDGLAAAALAAYRRRVQQAVAARAVPEGVS